MQMLIGHGQVPTIMPEASEKFPGKILLNPSVKEYHLYWQDDLIIIGKLLTEAPKGKKAVWHTCLEKMLVDMTAEKAIKTTFSEAEYPGVLEQAFQKYIIDESQMFRYAKRRHVKDDILKIIQNQTGINVAQQIKVLISRTKTSN